MIITSYSFLGWVSEREGGSISKRKISLLLLLLMLLLYLSLLLFAVAVVVGSLLAPSVLI